MFKASIEFAKINKTFKVKFGIIIESEQEIKQQGLQLISKFSYMGNDYMRVNPKPFLTIDITSKDDKSSEWNTNQTVSLNKRNLFVFLQALRQFLMEYKQIKDLYYYDDDHNLKLNNEISMKIIKDIIVSNKHIRLQPCVVPDENIKEMFYEGCIFCINTYDYYSYLSYAEMEYLYYELSHVNMTDLAISLINTVNLYQKNEFEKIEPKKVIAEKEEELPDSNKRFVKISEPNTIPEI